jgi:hypothetical protein
VNQIAPSLATTTSLGELSCRPRQPSMSVWRPPLARSRPLIRAGSQRPPLLAHDQATVAVCGHTVSLGDQDGDVTRLVERQGFDLNRG